MIFERNSKLQFTPVWYNISNKNGNLHTEITYFLKTQDVLVAKYKTRENSPSDEKD